MERKNRIEDLRTAKKITAIIIDLDGTLWQGSVVLQNPITLYFGRYEIINWLHLRGVQIFAVSMNEKTDVLKTFLSLGIDPNIFTYVSAQWVSQTASIADLMEAANLLPKNVVFVGDNKVIAEQIKKRFSAMHVLDPVDLPLLMDVPFIIGLHPESEEERESKKNCYRVRIKETLVMLKFGPDMEFQKTLKKEICVNIVSPNNLQKIVKLIFTTRRINFNYPQLKTEEELMKDTVSKVNSGQIVYAVSASQEGNPLGIIGAFIVKLGVGVATIENATFSNSIAGIGFEERAIVILSELLKKQGVNIMFINLLDTPVNSRIQKMLWCLEFEVAKQYFLPDEPRLIYRFNTKHSKKKIFSWIKENNQLAY